VERIGRAFEGVASQSRHVPQQYNFSTQNNFSQNDFSQNNFSTQNTFLTDDWHERGYKPRIPSSSSRGEVLAREHHRKGSLHRSAEQGFCCVLSRCATIRFDLHQRQAVTGCSRTQLTLHSPLTHTTRTHHLNFEHAQ